MDKIIIRENVIQVIKEIYNGDFEIDENTKFYVDLDFDSIDIVNFIVKLEKKFKVTFEDVANLTENIENVGMVIKLLDEMINE